MDSGAIGNGLIGIDGLVQLLAVEVVLEELLDLGDTGGATDQDDLVDAFSIIRDLLNDYKLTILVHAGITE